VLEYSGAFLQLYREEGFYLERTLHYVNRVGLDYVKKKILEDHDLRKALWERLQFALDGEPDPWFEHEKASVDTRQFVKVGSGSGNGSGHPYAEDAKDSQKTQKETTE
jgi:nitrite reductase (NADH) large subunit